MDTIKVKPWGKGQGDHVVINAADFDPKLHTKLTADDEPGGAKPPEKMKALELRALLEEHGIAIPDGVTGKVELLALWAKHEQDAKLEGGSGGDPT